MDYDYGMRIYDARIGKFLSVDPLTGKYPFYTPYQFAGNKPIWAVDVDGLEEYIKTYKYEDGKATLLSVTNNTYLKVVDLRPCDQCSHDYNQVVYDKRTDKPFNPKELGQVQFQYVDKDGKRLNIRRDYNGDFVKGANEIMPLGQNNFNGSVYIGPTNPTYIDNNHKEQPDYRREPTDEVDAAAEQHDKGYDALKAAGAGDAFFNRTLIPVDKKLVAAANAVVQKASTGGNDIVTNKPVTSATKYRANVVRKLFEYLLSAPAFKGKMPTGSTTETHVEH